MTSEYEITSWMLNIGCPETQQFKSKGNTGKKKGGGAYLKVTQMGSSSVFLIFF